MGDEYTIILMMEDISQHLQPNCLWNNPKVHRKPLGNNDPLLGGIDVVFEIEYEDYLSDKSGHFMNLFSEVDLHVLQTQQPIGHPGKHIMSLDEKERTKEIHQCSIHWLASNFQQAMLSESGHEYIASRETMLTT